MVKKRHPLWNGSRWVWSTSAAGLAIVWRHCKTVAINHAFRCAGCDLCRRASNVLSTSSGPIGPKPPALPPMAIAA